MVVLDNASIHKCYEFVRAVNWRGGIVLYLPPYCFDLTPLDNGAFGCVRRWLQRHARWVESVGVQEGLDCAFERFSGVHARTREERESARALARHCFRNCYGRFFI